MIASQDHAPGEHGRRGWKSRVEGIPFDSGGLDREPNRQEALRRMPGTPSDVLI